MEPGISGRNAQKRPMFQQMIATAKTQAHPFDAILIWKFSRFARNQEESIVYKSLLRKNNVEVISISEPLIDGPFGSLIERIIEWMDEYYSIRLSSEVIRGMTENAMRGNYQAAAPYGYYIPHKCSPPQIQPEEANVIRLIYDMYVNQQASPYAIARYLNQAGLQSKRGNAFESRTIQYILENPIYAGCARWNKRSHSGGSAILNPADEWIHAKGNFEPIVSDTMYEKAQLLLTQNQKCSAKKPDPCKKHWLSGMVKCSACHRSLALSRTTNKKNNKIYLNFQCYGYLKGICTISHQISEKRLVPPVLDAIDQVTALRKANYQLIHTAPESVHMDLDLCTSQLAKVEKKLERARFAYVNGIDTLDEYQILKTKLTQEKEDIILRQNQLAKNFHTASDSSQTSSSPSNAHSKNDSTTVDDSYYTITTQPPATLSPFDSLSQLLLMKAFSLEQKQVAFHCIIKEIIFYKKQNCIHVIFSLNANHCR